MIESHHECEKREYNSQSLHKYKCLWGVGGKGQGSSLQEGALHTYILRLD